MLLKPIVFLSLVFSGVSAYAQSPIPVLVSSVSRSDSTEARVASLVNVGGEISLARIDICFLSDKESANFPSVPGQYLLHSGEVSLPLLDIYPLQRGSIMRDDTGWSDIKAGDCFSVMMCFAGTIPDGIHEISIKPRDSTCFFSFPVVGLDNPSRKFPSDFRLSEISSGTYLYSTCTKEHIIEELKDGVPILVDYSDTLNTQDFYCAVELNTGNAGYVERKCVSDRKRISPPETGNFILVSSFSESHDSPKVTLTNKTNVRMTVYVSSRQLTVKPYKHKTVSLREGTNYFLICSPGNQDHVEYSFFRTGCTYTRELTGQTHFF